MADALGVPERRYASWEREEVTMFFPQAVACAEILNCTTDALAGRSVDDRKLTDPYEQELVDCYRSSTVDRQGFNVNESYNSYDSKSAGQEFRKFSEFISISIYRDYSGKNSGKPLITSLQCPHSDI